MYRLIALDIDGTLLDPSGRVSPANRRAIARARRAGVKVILDTGRSWQEAWGVARAAGVDPLMVCQGGGALADLTLRRNIRHWPMGEETALALLRLLGREELGLLAFAGEELVINPRTDRMFQTYDCPLFHRGKTVTEDIPAFLAERGLRVNKIFAKGDPASFPAILKKLAPWEGEVYATASAGDNFELLPLGVDKGSGLAAAAAALGVPLEETACMGDNDNDRGMFAAAGLAVAMGNAAPAIQALCPHVTADNGHDGVARAIEDILAGRLG